MKKSTTKPLAILGCVPYESPEPVRPLASCSLSRRRRTWWQRNHGCAIHKKLRTRHDHLVAILQTALHGIIVSYCVAHRNGLLFGEILSALVLRKVDKGLAALPRDREHGNHSLRCSTPGNARPDQLRRAQNFRARMNRGLYQNSLQPALDLR